MEPWSVGLRDPVNTWPDDLREALAKRYEAFWGDPGSKDVFECVDNERACRLGNQAEEDAFKAVAADGCCGSNEEDWEFIVPSGKVIVRYGFNHGH